MARRLKTMARYINDKWDGYGAKVVRSHSSTDRKVGRLRIPGKGIRGNRLLVWRESDRRIVFDHDSTHGFRTNAEVEEWITKVENGRYELDPRESFMDHGWAGPSRVDLVTWR